MAMDWAAAEAAVSPERHKCNERGYDDNEKPQGDERAAAAVAGIPAFAAEALAARPALSAQRFVRRGAKASCAHGTSSAAVTASYEVSIPL